ncbi:MAG TPA: hypothetical protein VKF62_11380 [Planctomycetota bacterium]|nr:hypothetical protein [Planctomycetota bacterium]
MRTLLPLLLLLGACQMTPSVEVSVAAFAPVFGGDAQQGASNPSIDLEEGLDLEDRDIVPAGSIAVEWVGLRVQVSGFQTDVDGEKVLGSDFGGIPAGTLVDTEGRLRNARASVVLSGIDAGFIKIRPGVGVEWIDFDLDADSAATHEEIEAMAVIPVVVLNGEVELGPARLVADVAGIYGEFQDLEGALIDGEATLRLGIAGPVEIFAGYRYLDGDLEGTTDGIPFDVALRVHGPIAGIGVRF